TTPETVTATTLAPDGSFSATLHAYTTPGKGTVKATFVKTIAKTVYSAESSYEVEGSHSLGLISSRLTLRAGESTNVGLALFRSGMPLSGANVVLIATGGTLSVPSVVTDGQGRGSFNFTAGDSNGEATVTATYSLPSPTNGTPLVFNDQTKFISTGDVTLNLNTQQGAGASPRNALRASPQTLNNTSATVYDGSLARLDADLVVGGDRVAALPVRFTLDGAGELGT